MTHYFLLLTAIEFDQWAVEAGQWMESELRLNREDEQPLARHRVSIDGS